MPSRPVFISFLCLLLLQAGSSTQFTLDPCCKDSDCADERRRCTFLEELEGGGFDSGPCVSGKECFCSQGEQGFAPCIVDLECLEGDVCQSGMFTVCVSQCFLARERGRELDEEEKLLCDEQPSFPKICPPENLMDSELPEMPNEVAPPAPTSSPISQPTPILQSMPDPDVEPSAVEEPTASDEAEAQESISPFEDLEPREPAPTPEPEETPQIIVATPEPVSVAEASPTAEVPDATPTPDVEESPEPTNAVCVAVEELKGVQKVFEQDYHAWVLCDSAGSCATPGHMVMWNGDGMMMKSYCDIVGCERKVMAVNSPRWSAGVIRAKTEGLSYTSFAARWESRAEERVLSAVVRIAF